MTGLERKQKTYKKILEAERTLEKPIRNKRQFVGLYKRGRFGNASPTWDTVKDFIDHYELDWPNDHERFHLRNRDPGGATYYNESYTSIVNRSLWNHDLTNFYVSAMAPTYKTLIQGEVRRSVLGLELRYTTIRKPMREALLAHENTTTGLIAKMLLMRYLDSNSYDWLIELLDRYVDHIVEFSTYSVQWGTVPGFNSVFWEVRPDRGFGSNLSPFTEGY